MEQIQAPKKWSDLHGLAVVDVTSGKKVGTLDDFYFDVSTGAVVALRVKTGLLNYKQLPVSAINALGSDAITISQEGSLQPEEKQASPIARGSALEAYKVMSASGTIVGTLGQVILETSSPNAPKIAAFELKSGLRSLFSGKHLTFASDQVQTYGQDVLIVPDTVVQTLQ